MVTRFGVQSDLDIAALVLGAAHQVDLSAVRPGGARGGIDREVSALWSPRQPVVSHGAAGGKPFAKEEVERRWHC